MSLLSVQFLIIFILILTVYYLLPGRFQWVWLFLTSLFFYYESSNVRQLVIFLLYIAFNWAAAVLMQKKDEQKKKIFAFTLTLDLLLILFLKHLDMISLIFIRLIRLFAPSFDGAALQQTTGRILEFSPAHISYFALILIGYLTDVYRGKYEAQKNPCKVVLFAGFFPQMTSGPLVRYADMQPQLFGEKNRFDYENVIRGAERALWGIFKKLVISERCAVIVNAVYPYYEAYTGFYVIIASIMYALQLYTDFSGLMDIVLGVSQCLGIKLPENFNTPLYSRSIAELWRRWHMTLGGFLRDYLYIPLGGNRKGKLCKYRNLTIVFLASALWHGLDPKYLFGIGLFMSAVIVSGELLGPFFQKVTAACRIDTECFSWVLFQRIRTFLLFVFGISFFRVSSIKDGFLMWKSAFSSFNPWILFDRSLYELGLSKDEWLIMVFGLLLLLVVSILQQKGSVREFLHKQNFPFRLLLFVVLFVLVINWGYYGTNFVASDFIYGRF